MSRGYRRGCRRSGKDGGQIARRRRFGLRLRERLLKVCPSPRRIDSPNKAREIPHFAQVPSEQAVRLLQCGIIVVAIDNVRRPRNAPILTKLVHAINCHGAPEAQQTRFDVRGRAQARQRVRRFCFGESPDYPTVIICEYLRQMSGEGAQSAKTLSSSAIISTRHEKGGAF